MRTEPPLWARMVLRLLVPEKEREFFLGDLTERRTRSWLREVLGAAALRLGSGSRESHSEHRKGDTMFEEILRDLRFGLRTLLRSPAFTLVALLTMALGIGANTAVFSVVRGVLLKPLPYPESERIVRLAESNLAMGFETFSIAPPNLRDWRERTRSLERIGAYQTGSAGWTGGQEPEILSALRVSEDYLPILGFEPAQGRGITRDDLDPAGAPVAVLAHAFWQGALGGGAGAVGSTIVLDDVPHTIVGILPEGWEAPGGRRSDVLLPLTPAPWWGEARGSHFLHAFGRLAPGATLEQARAELSTIAADLEAEYPDTNGGWGAVVRSLDDMVLGSTRPQLRLFMASVALILLIACANLANMVLARSASRSREMAIRTAMGAGRARVVRQLMAESLLVALGGGALGVGLAWAALEGFVRGWPDLLPRMHEIELDPAVLLFSLALSVASGVLFGLFPALDLAGSRVGDTLRQTGRGVAGDRSRRWMRSALVTSEVALAVVLLVGAGLLVRSFAALEGEDPGFVARDRLVLSIPLSRTRYSTEDDRRAFADAVLPRLRAVPGVESAALSSLVPLGSSDEVWGLRLEGTPATGMEDDNALFYRVSPGYFETMGIPVLAGRDIGPGDGTDAAPVVVVSASLVERLFPGEDPLGKRFRFDREEDSPYVEIVGVVGDVEHYRLGDLTHPQIYVPFAQRPTGSFSIVLKSALPTASLIPSARQALAGVDPGQPIARVHSADALLVDAVATPRFRSLLMGVFGLTALLLAVVGLYGVAAYGVSQRTKEIGVRMALGASRGSVLRMVLREGGPLVAAGLAVGLAGALAGSRILESMLFGVESRDPAVFTAVPVLLALVAAVALWVPARRATRVDPLRALAEE